MRLLLKETCIILRAADFPRMNSGGRFKFVKSARLQLRCRTGGTLFLNTIKLAFHQMAGFAVRWINSIST